jgi:hypothetical protein
VCNYCCGYCCCLLFVVCCLLFVVVLLFIVCCFLLFVVCLLFSSLNSHPTERTKPNTPHKDLPANAGEESIANFDHLLNKKGNIWTADLRGRMQDIMQAHAAGYIVVALLLHCFK